MPSLLSQFFNSIKGSQEDIASKGLVYILQSSSTARDYLTRFIANQTGIELGALSYTVQNAGENSERPDISGFDGNGNEKIIIEAKFWASLTSNQPITYLTRLKSDSVLLFICPKLREISLFNEIEARIKAEKPHYEKINHLLCSDNNKKICISDWSTILAGMRDALSENKERLLVSDIDQIIGFCEVIDSTAFLPIQDFDVSPAIARRINSYCDLIDKVVERLKSDCGVSTDSLKSTGQKYGYTRYFIAGTTGFALEVHLKLWETHADTPFWLSARNIDHDGKWLQQSHELKSALKMISLKTGIRLVEKDQMFFFALIPCRNVPEDLVLNGLVQNFARIVAELNLPNIREKAL